MFAFLYLCCLSCLILLHILGVSFFSLFLLNTINIMEFSFLCDKINLNINWLPFQFNFLCHLLESIKRRLSCSLLLHTFSCWLKFKAYFKAVNTMLEYAGAGGFGPFVLFIENSLKTILFQISCFFLLLCLYPSFLLFKIICMYVLDVSTPLFFAFQCCLVKLVL